MKILYGIVCISHEDTLEVSLETFMNHSDNFN